MKAMRYAVMALACYAAFWGAAHVGFLPGLNAGQGVETPMRVSREAGMGRALRRYIPITLR